MRRDLQAALGWTAVQLVERPTSSPPRGFVIDDELAGLAEHDLRDVRSELRALQGAGIPPDTDRGKPNFQGIPRRCPGHSQVTDFFVLKCKPSGWRLYFIVDASRRYFIFLYAVHKKKDKRDPGDVAKCCTRLARLKELARSRIECLARLDPILVS